MKSINAMILAVAVGMLPVSAGAQLSGGPDPNLVPLDFPIMVLHSQGVRMVGFKELDERRQAAVGTAFLGVQVGSGGSGAKCSTVSGDGWGSVACFADGCACSIDWDLKTKRIDFGCTCG